MIHGPEPPYLLISRQNRNPFNNLSVHQNVSVNTDNNVSRNDEEQRRNIPNFVPVSSQSNSNNMKNLDGALRRQIQRPSTTPHYQSSNRSVRNQNRNNDGFQIIASQNVSLQNEIQPIRSQQNRNLSSAIEYRAQINSVNLGKMDGIFAESFQIIKYKHIAQTFIVFILFMGPLLLYKFKVFKGIAGQQFGYIQDEEHLKFSILPVINLFQSIVLIGKVYFYVMGYASLVLALETAQKIGSSSRQQSADLRNGFRQNISERYLYVETSTTYNQDINEMLKKTLLGQTQKKIKRSVRDHFFCSYQIMEISSFGMLVCAVFLIVALAQGHTTWVEKVLLISIIVYWMLINYRKIFYAGILVLCPFLTVGVLIYACFCAEGRKQVEIPKAINPTEQQILESGGTCSICMMEFERLDSVVILPCDRKHMFHELCIKGWLNVKTTCPICRFNLQTNT